MIFLPSRPVVPSPSSNRTGLMLMRHPLAFALLLAGPLAGCNPYIAPSPFARVSIEQLEADPARWTGEAVEVAGVVEAVAGKGSRLTENCGSSAVSIPVDWELVPGFRDTDDGARVRVRGTFRDDGAVHNKRDLSGGSSPNRGALENVSILWRMPESGPRCHF